MTSKIMLSGLIVISLAIISAWVMLIRFPNLKNLVVSSPIVQEERTVSDFNQINFSGIGEVDIVQTGQSGIHISAAANLLPDIITVVENNILNITFRWDWQKNSLKNQRPVRILVQVVDLNKVIISGAGSVRSPLIRSSILHLSLAGASTADFNVEVDTLTSEISGAGQIILKGRSKNQKVNISGAGIYMAQNLLSDQASVSISGLGTAELNAKSSLDITLSGGGKVAYFGNPKITQEISGLGTVTKQK